MTEKTSTTLPSKTPTPPVSGPLAQFEAWLYDMLVVKAPFQLPKGLTDFLVQYGPWITLVLAVLSLPALLAVLGLGVFVGGLGAYYAGVNASIFYWLSMVVLAAQIVVMFVSVPMLLKRQRNGWLLLFYVEMFYVAYTVLGALANPYGFVGSLIGAAIGAVIGFYVLFQIRSYYTK
jgi:hypothetical protein